MDDPLKKVHQVFQSVQKMENKEVHAGLDSMRKLANNWKDGETPALQRQVVDLQLQNIRNGIIDPVFSSLIQLLKRVSLDSFSFLDAACATGYYSEVIKMLDRRNIAYSGCDYSAAMVQAAREYYPQTQFEVQDLTGLQYPDMSFDVVMAAGVLEHIPDWEKAVSETCRVARHYVIHHRCPLSAEGNHEYTIGSQYNIETPRIYFSREKLLREFKHRGFRLVHELDVYNPASLIQKLRERARHLLLKKEPAERRTISFLYRRA